MIFFLIDNVYSRYFSTLIFIVAALTDLYDGYLARKTGVITGFGKFSSTEVDNPSFFLTRRVMPVKVEISNLIL